MDNLQRQFDDLRTETREDFKFMMLALGVAKSEMDEAHRRIDELGQRFAEVGQQLGRVHGRMGRQEERFELMLDVVQQAVNEVKAQPATRAELDEIRGRLERLEKKIA